MANPLQIQNKTRLIESRLAALFGGILNDYKAGTIKTKPELEYRLFGALKDFYSQIGLPLFHVKPVWGIPVSEEWNLMMDQIYKDITTLLEEADLMSKAIEESFTQVETQRQGWQGLTLQMQNLLNDLQVRITAKLHETIFNEQFQDMNNYDQQMPKDFPADIVKESQVLTLKRSAANDWTADATIKIVSGNGFPGNTHQVRALTGVLKFYGEDNLHVNIAEIVDGNQDTWFEYELFGLNPSVIEKTSRLGFSYKEGYEWAQEDVTILYLTLQINLVKSRVINWINIAPFLPSDKGVAAAVIRSIVVSDSKGDYLELAGSGQNFNKEIIHQFQKIDCKSVTILLEQRIPYLASTGHIYFNELDEQGAAYIQKNARENAGRRIEGPQPVVDNVQLHYDPSLKKLILPEAKNGDTIQNDVEIKKNLFQLPENPSGVQVALESLDLWRYVIGIRDIGISEYQFEKSSEYTSVSYKTDLPIREISLDVLQEVPQLFMLSTEKQSWVDYFISIDEGKTWLPIAPRSRTGMVRKYLVNSGTPKAERFSDTGYIETLAEINAVRLRIMMYRPTTLVDANFYTPVIRGYKLHVITEAEA